MLVTFRTPAHGDISYFGEVAHVLLRLMGHSATVPGALAAEDVPAALENLRQGLRAGAQAPPPSEYRTGEEDEEEAPVPLSHRALPLVELLEAAERSGEYVMWDKR
ncbi:DUF1840 domain-containing protein [Thioalkalivibrio thiocyanodenitrificans]|uniref:DUF1840 domain-containing protein n=1 Tax=Thioalkalivibrio thiocyanodenitrificans TaxID=243063 RepID=UPI00037D3960|nr:DUF1840 domain-containing protein [Thioalkalivibrio thiocyanodenitrificans]